MSRAASTCDPRPLPAEAQEALHLAAERALDLGYAVFKSQVVPYLSADIQPLYDTEASWTAMQDRVAERLLGLQ